MTQSILDFGAQSGAVRAPKRIDRWARAAIHARLHQIRDGALHVIDAFGEEQFGEPGAALRATVRIEDARTYRSLLARGALGGAEAYIDGHWRSDDLTAVMQVLARNEQALAGLDRGLARWARPSLRLYHAMRRNTRTGSKRNIAAHYDLGNEFFELFLDPTLTYSSGVFESADASMQDASVAKYERLCQKLRIGRDDHVLEIGTGWGGFALHAAGVHGCRVTTTTISQRQYELARERVREAGLEDRIEVLFEDYRDLRGTYDKLVSIEMIEAVGHEHLDAFFRACSERLQPDGVMALQAITVSDRDIVSHRRSIDFIKRYIFPGGELLAVGALSSAAARAGELRATHVEDLTPHYAETLRRWRHRMFENLDAMRALGLGDEFLRMWEYYLCYCEGGFEERSIGLVQTVFEKARTRRPSLIGDIA